MKNQVSLKVRFEQFFFYSLPYSKVIDLFIYFETELKGR